MQELRKSKEGEFIYNIWSDNLPADSTPRAVEFLSHMTWRFLIAENGQYFITSDNPLFFFQDMGIGKKLSEVSIPIAKNLALWTTWRNDLVEGYFPARTRVVKEINRRIASISKQFIFSSFSERWIRTLADKTIYKLNRIMK